MWCSNCQADVAAEVASGSDRARCATCGTEVGGGTTVRTSVKTEAARDLLKRWANDQLLDPFGPLPGLSADAQQSSDPLNRPPSSSSQAARGSGAVDPAGQVKSPRTGDPGSERPVREFDSFQQSTSLLGSEASPAANENAISSDAGRILSETPGNSSKPAPVFRLDTAHSAADLLGSTSANADRTKSVADGDLGKHDPNPASVTTDKVVHPRHAARPSGPHFDVQSAIEEEHLRNPNWAAFWGQILAYFGVAGLTVGTAMVLWGYFGGPSSYTPTGWLIATAGQMLLFLGVVTLISGGMEQTTDEVARRIDRLGQQLIRIERGSRDHGLRGPHALRREDGGLRTDDGDFDRSSVHSPLGAGEHRETGIDDRR